jgi:hypothetical protein
MDKGLKLQAQEWFDRGDHDIETAQLLYAQSEAIWISWGFVLFKAAEGPLWWPWTGP